MTMVVTERVEDPVIDPVLAGPPLTPAADQREVVVAGPARPEALAAQELEASADAPDAPAADGLDAPELEARADRVPAPRDGEARPGGAPRLAPREEMILAFERRWWRHAGAKEQAIRDTFGLSPTRYYQLLNGLLDNPAALAHDPVLVNRLRRLRASRGRSRAL